MKAKQASAAILMFGKEQDKIIPQNYKNSMVLAQKQIYRSMQENRRPRNKHRQLQPHDFDKGAQILEKRVSLKKQCWGNWVAT